MNVFRYIILTCSAAADIGLLIFGVIGLITYWDEPYSSVPLAMVVIWTLGALALTGLTLWSFYRTAKGKKLPVLYGFFWKIVVFMLVLSGTWFSLEIPEAGWLALALSAMLGALLFFLPKLRGGPQVRPQKGQAVKLPAFRVDKAEWAWEEAAAEYFRLRGTVYDIGDHEQYKAFQDRISALGEGESDRIYDYAGMPIAYFLGWLIRRDLMSDDFRSLYDQALLQAVKDETKSPLEVLRNMDYVLAKEDIGQEALRFMNYYYEIEGNNSSFNHKTDKYFFDYYRTVCSRFDVPRYYCVDFDPERFHELEEVLDRRYAEFNNRGPAEDDLEEDGRKLRTHYFDTEAELFHEPGTPPEYVNLCADAYKTMGGRLSRAISGELLEYCTEDLPGEDVPSEKILPHFHPKRVVVMKPVSLRTPGAHDHGPETEEPVSAYVILGESDWEQEHGIAFTVIGDCVVNSSFYADALSPWTEDMMWEYRRQRDAELGNFCEAEAVPAQFGGAGNDRIRMLAASARRKEEIDEMIEALFVLKMAEKYDYKIVYSGNEPNYIFIAATKGEIRTFADSIRLR